MQAKVRAKVRAKVQAVVVRFRRAEVTWLLWWIGTGVLALGLLPLNIALPAEQFDVHPLLAFATGIGQSTALMLILVRPREATALQFVASTAMSLALPGDSGSTWPLTVTGIITLIAHVGLIAARYPRPTALTVWWASALLPPALIAIDIRGRSFTDGTGVMILYPIFSFIVLGIILLRRRWKDIRRELADARHDVEVEQSQRAVAEERTRIARELHDVVAHGMSVIHMQATSASYRIADLSPEVKAEFARIATDARTSLREMRQLLAVLRDETADPDLAPVPDLSRIDELVESAERAGLKIETHVEITEFAEGRTAYRIVQESLSNVIRHAPGARTTITIKEDGEDVVVVIENDKPPRPVEKLETGGQGQRGMRERARLAGGSLEAGERDDGGYRVVARLPKGGEQ